MSEQHQIVLQAISMPHIFGVVAVLCPSIHCGLLLGFRVTWAASHPLEPLSGCLKGKGSRHLPWALPGHGPRSLQSQQIPTTCLLSCD